MKFLKTKIVLALVALEVVCLPISIAASAKMADKMLFSTPGRAVYSAAAAMPGETIIFVASNTPYSVIASGVVGELGVHIESSGVVKGKIFGKNAQHPGRPLACVAQNRPTPTLIYQSVTKTAERRGAVIDQAVKMRITYPPSAHPEFIVKPNTHDLVQAAHALASCEMPEI